MSSGQGDEPPRGSSAPTAPGRPAQETPQRLVVRTHDSGHESAAIGASDTAVAARTSASDIGRLNTDAVPKLDRGLLADLVGITLSGRYIVKRKVGQGGMGAVYEATHAEIGGRYAVKVLLEKYA